MKNIFTNGIWECLEEVVLESEVSVQTLWEGESQ